VISFKLPIKVIPKKRPRVTKRGTYMPDDYKKQRDYIRAKIRPFKSLGNVPLRLNVVFGFKLPKRGIKGNKLSMPVGDLDNLAGAMLDACQGCLFDDDRQVTEIMAKKLWSDEDFVMVVFEKVKL